MSSSERRGHRLTAEPRNLPLHRDVRSAADAKAEMPEDTMDRARGLHGLDELLIGPTPLLARYPNHGRTLTRTTDKKPYFLFFSVFVNTEKTSSSPAPVDS